MQKKQNLFPLAFLILVIAALLSGFYWANLKFIQTSQGGMDFIVPWKAMQNFMMQGITPYGTLTSLNIQTLIFGHMASPGQNIFGVNIPLNYLVFYFPLSWISDLTIARSIWMVFQELSFFLIVFITLKLVRWKFQWWFLVLMLLFSTFWLPSISMIYSGTSILLQALLVLLAIRSIEIGSDELAGGLLALSLVNIEATGLVLISFLVWIISNQRWRILGGILMTLVILWGLAFLLLSSWFLPFVGIVLADWRSGGFPSTFTVLEGWFPGIGLRLAQLLAVAVLTDLFFEWRAVRGKDVRWLVWTVCFTAVITPLVGVPYFPKWTIYTLPALLLCFVVLTERWRLIGFITSIFLMVLIFFALWLAQLRGWISIFILFYPLTLVLLMYWVRWGVVRQPRLWADDLMRKG